MKPITEDQVLSLIKGVEVREKNALKCLARSVQHQDGGGQLVQGRADGVHVGVIIEAEDDFVGEDHSGFVAGRGQDGKGARHAGLLVKTCGFRVVQGEDVHAFG